MEYTKQSEQQCYVIRKAECPAVYHNDEPVPVEPIVHLNYGAGSPESFLESGRFDTRKMMTCIQSNGGLLAEGSRILDFGCGSGRMLRWIPEYVANGEYWGCDTTAKAITWAQAHLGPRFRLFTNLREPHLPFSDGYFDLIYAGSVFSHVDDLADYWLLELRRVIKVNRGILFVTFQNEHSLEVIARQNTAATKGYYQRLYNELFIQKYIGVSFDKVVVGKTAYTSQVFYDSSWFRQHLGCYFDRVVIIQEAYGWQSGALLSYFG